MICAMLKKNWHFQAKSLVYYENNYITNVILVGDVFGEDVLLFTLQVRLFPWLTNHLKKILHLLVQKV